MKIIGHRGARGLAPENTVAGLRKALEHHVNMLEFDVRVSQDGVPVLHHDTALIDAGGNKLKIGEHGYKELLTHKSDLANLEDVLKTFASRSVPLVVEVKPGEQTRPIIKILRAHGQSNVYLASLSQKTLLELHHALPEVEKIVIERWSGVRAARRMRQLGATKVFMNQRWLWRGFIHGFKHSNKQLFAYTLNDPAKARHWAGWGLSGVITDYPDRFEK